MLAITEREGHDDDIDDDNDGDGNDNALSKCADVSKKKTSPSRILSLSLYGYVHNIRKVSGEEIFLAADFSFPNFRSVA